LKLSGQYQRLANAGIDFKFNQNKDHKKCPIVNQLMVGQLNASVPVFQVLNQIAFSAQDLYEAEMANAEQTKRRNSLCVIDYYANSYKAQNN
jgi:hypothetical protein